MLVTLVFLFLSSSSAYAEKMTASVIDVAPLGFMDGTEKKGLYVEVLQAIAKAGQFEIEIHLVPYLRAISMVESKDVDLTVMFDTPISDKIKTQKVPLYERTLYIYTLKERLFLSAKDLVGEIGRLNGACFDLENNNNRTQLVNIGSFEQGMQLLKRKRLRGVCGTRASIYSACNKLKISMDQFTNVVLAKKIFAAHFHPEAKIEKIEKFRKALQIIKNNGVLQKIRIKYHDTIQ